MPTKKAQKSRFKWRYASPEKQEKRRYELYSQFALSQCHMGVKTTLDTKDKIVGCTTLANCPIEDFEKLIHKLRKMFRRGDYNLYPKIQTTEENL